MTRQTIEMRSRDRSVARSSTLTAQVAPAPAPAPRSSTVILLTDHALDGRGRRVEQPRALASRRESLLPTAAQSIPPTIDLRGYTVLPRWKSIRTCTSTRTSIARDTSRTRPSSAEAGARMANSASAHAHGGIHDRAIRRRELGTFRLRDMIRIAIFRSARLTSLRLFRPTRRCPTTRRRAMVRRRKKQGADLIKIFASKSQESAVRSNDHRGSASGPL